MNKQLEELEKIKYNMHSGNGISFNTLNAPLSIPMVRRKYNEIVKYINDNIPNYGYHGLGRHLALFIKKFQPYISIERIPSIRGVLFCGYPRVKIDSSYIDIWRFEIILDRKGPMTEIFYHLWGDYMMDDENMVSNWKKGQAIYY